MGFRVYTIAQIEGLLDYLTNELVQYYIHRKKDLQKAEHISNLWQSIKDDLASLTAYATEVDGKS